MVLIKKSLKSEILATLYQCYLIGKKNFVSYFQVWKIDKKKSANWAKHTNFWENMLSKKARVATKKIAFPLESCHMNRVYYTGNSLQRKMYWNMRVNEARKNKCISFSLVRYILEKWTILFHLDFVLKLILCYSF